MVQDCKRELIFCTPCAWEEHTQEEKKCMAPGTLVKKTCDSVIRKRSRNYHTFAYSLNQLG